MRKLSKLLTLSLILTSNCSNAITASSFDESNPISGPINYYGGPVITNPTKVNFVWYGNWNNVSAQSTIANLEYLVNNIDSTNWWKIVSDYYQTINQQTVHATSQISFGQSYYINYSFGKSLYDSDVISILQKLSLNKEDIYLVFISQDINESGSRGQYCVDYCGWHESWNINNQNIKFALVGQSDCDICSLQLRYQELGFNYPPSGTWDSLNMTQVLLHELAEIITDPVGTKPAWQDLNHQELSDKCLWTYGDTLYNSDNGSVGNILVGNKVFMTQQLWSKNTNSCSMFLN